MKKTLLTLALAVTHLAAFAQANVTFGNDANHLVVFDLDTFGPYAPYAGRPVPQLGTLDDQFQYFTAQLYAGTSAISLTLQTTITPAGQAGLPDGWIGNQAVTLSDIPAGTAFFQIQIWETAYGSYENAFYRGQTPVFEATAGSFAPEPLTSSPDWAAAPIVLQGIPEPPTFALAGLGVASLLLFRRRKFAYSAVPFVFSWVCLAIACGSKKRLRATNKTECADSHRLPRVVRSSAFTRLPDRLKAELQTLRSGSFPTKSASLESRNWPGSFRFAAILILADG